MDYLFNSSHITSNVRYLNMCLHADTIIPVSSLIKVCNNDDFEYLSIKIVYCFWYMAIIDLMLKTQNHHNNYR